MLLQEWRRRDFLLTKLSPYWQMINLFNLNLTMMVEVSASANTSLTYLIEKIPHPPDLMPICPVLRRTSYSIALITLTSTQPPHPTAPHQHLQLMGLPPRTLTGCKPWCWCRNTLFHPDHRLNWGVGLTWFWRTVTLFLWIEENNFTNPIINELFSF